MELTDICPLSQWERLENDIYDRFRLQGSVFNPQGMRITQVKNWSNRLCPSIKSTEKGQSFICSVAHMNMTAMVKNSREAVVEECDAGFAKVVVPIFVDDEFLGVAGGCGLVAEGEEADTFAVTQLSGIPEAEVAELSSDLPFISKESIGEVTAFIQDRLAGLVSDYQKKVAGN